MTTTNRRTVGTLMTAGLMAALVACQETTKSTASWTPPTPPPPPSTNGQLVAAQYCGGCHGQDLMGKSIDTLLAVRLPPEPGTVLSPSLARADGYSWEDFNRLVSAGVTRDDQAGYHRMVTSGIATISYEDRRALYDYLSTYAGP